MSEALFYEKLSNQQVKCRLCHQFCQISLGRRGFCGVRENQNGVLQTLVYGKVIAANVDQIEKKPLYHFLPGSYSFSMATVGCNFSCANCQNADISQAAKVQDKKRQLALPGSDLSSQDVVDQALKLNCQSISYTYTEPTVFFEFALDCMKLAKEKGLKNVWVSNGYTAQPALEMAKPYLDAVNVDLKFFEDKIYQKICGAKLQPVLDNLVWYKQNKIWLEVTTLVIPTLNDDTIQLTKIAKFIKEKLGIETPWHVSAFFPTYKLNRLSPTLAADIKKAWQIGKDIGLRNVYSGNISYPHMENTYCPNCSELVIERQGYKIKRFDKANHCQKCGYKLDLIS